MPSDLKWTQLSQKGEVTPKPRSGHTLTWVSNMNYIMFGGIEDPGSGMQKVVPNNDVWSMKMSPKECRWEKDEIPSDDGTLPAPRT
jgi:hypothetical protein